MNNLQRFKQFFKQNKVKFIVLIIALIFGGASTAATLAGGISTLLYIVALAIAIQLTFEWREFKQ